jgi:LmbE family N-acetylglucosaminyl deacetylase
MKAFDPDPKTRWLFCLTHPDDEISICAWIYRLCLGGNEVFLSWTHYTPKRKAEALKVANLLGIPEERLRFHDGRDGMVCDHISDLVPGFRHMISEIAPDRIACGAFEQGHLDHDATNLLVNQAFAGPIFEIPFYHTYLSRRPKVNRFADPANEEVLDLGEDERRFKLKFAKMYPSQAIWRNLVLDEARRRLVASHNEPLHHTERMRKQTHCDFLTPNLPEPLLGRVTASDKWARWESAVRAIL